MRRNYYYLVAGLQDIVLDISKLQYDQSAFRELLKESLHPTDYKLVEKLYLHYDNKNLLNLLQKSGEPFDEKGNISRERLEENIREAVDLPDYMKRFITAYQNDEPFWPGLSPENELAALFYEEMLRMDNDFLSAWFRFDLQVKNLLTAVVSRKFNNAFASQIIGSDEVSEAIRKSHLRDFGLAGEPDFVEAVLEMASVEDVQTREKSLDQLRWQYLDDATFFEYFTIEKLLAFVIKLGLAERWIHLDHAHGEQMFRMILDELQKGYKLPASFTEK